MFVTRTTQTHTYTVFMNAKKVVHIVTTAL